MAEGIKSKIIQGPRLTAVLAPRLGRYFDLLPLPVDQLAGAVESAVEENPFLMLDERWFAGRRRTLQSRSGKSLESYEGDGSYQDRDAWLSERPRSLQAHLLDELHLHSGSERTFNLGLAIIGEINEDGFLERPLEDIAPWVEATSAELEEVLERVVFKFEPPGIGARNLKEALILQIKAQQPKDYHLILTAVDNYLSDVSKGDSKALARKMKVNQEQADEIIEYIGSLEPIPARGFQQGYNPLISVDLVAQIDSNEMKVAYLEETAPRLYLNKGYVKLLEGGEGVTEEEHKFLQEKLASAKDFIWALERRQETVLEVARAVLVSQREFFRRGEKGMRPLKLSDIAKRVNYSISTVSRAVAGKKIETPLGIFPLKFFFNPQVAGRSRHVILEAITRLVEKEPKARPLADDNIAGELSGQGIRIARRTVAKYRKILGIPTASRRKKNEG
jgi:RNA polymerase sigma-54 factor